MKKILVIGHKGFLGKCLFLSLSHLKKHQVIGWDLPEKNLAQGCASEILNLRPDVVVHFALRQQRENILSTINGILTNEVLNAISHMDKPPLTVLACDAVEYGNVCEFNIPIREKQPLRPSNLYAVSQCLVDNLGLAYYKEFGLPIIRLRFFEIIGTELPASFPIANYASHIVQIEKKTRPPVIRVKNLEFIRDYISIVDAVRALVLTIDKGIPGMVYNVCSGTGISIKEIVGRLFSLSKEKNISVEFDPNEKNNSNEPKIVVGDPSRFCLQTGWKAEKDLTKTLTEMLEWWRSK